MLNFDVYDKYVSTSLSNLANDSITVFPDLDKQTLNIIGNVVSGAVKQLKDGTTYVPDFEHLPKDIKEKLKKGIYKLGESRQVEGNLRPVVLDENGDRIKDVTLKKVKNSNSVNYNDISSRLQLKEINEKLDTIKELQFYQIERNRDEVIIAPFFNARDYILRAQNEIDSVKKEGLLEEANKELTNACNQTCLELNTNKAFLIKNSSKILKKQRDINVFVDHMADDIQLLTIYTAVQMQVLDYLGCYDDSKQVYLKYRNFIYNFATDRNNKLSMSGFELMHDNCAYQKGYKDLWYKFSLEICDKMSTPKIESKDIILIGLEDDTDEN